MRRVLRVLGGSLIAGGFIVLAYVAWLLWGTGIYTGQAQGDLRDEFNRRVESNEPTRPVALAGDAIAVLEIPKIDVDVVVVEGTALDDLKRGPGHYTETAYPWQDKGTVGIAGHRTTYGAPFWSLDKLRKGDTMFLRTERGDFRYQVTKLEEVSPTEVSVLDPSKEPTLVLTTCAPRFSAARRLIVYARRV